MEPEDKTSGFGERADDFVFDDQLDEETLQAIAEGEADIAAGRVVSHEVVTRWIRSWGTETELPPPECGD